MKFILYWMIFCAIVATLIIIIRSPKKEFEDFWHLFTAWMAAAIWFPILLFVVGCRKLLGIEPMQRFWKYILKELLLYEKK